nr:hypothetical protein [Tanacetum cinerariifolium]
MATLKFCDTHNMIVYLNKTEGSEGFHQIVGFLISSHIKFSLTENPTIYTSLIQQFWQTAVANTLDTGEIQIIATIDRNVKLISEASIRMHLKLEDSDGIFTLPNTEIFEQLSLRGPKKTTWEQFSSNIATAIICLVTKRTFNFSKMIFEGMVKEYQEKDKNRIKIGQKQKALIPVFRKFKELVLMLLPCPVKKGWKGTGSNFGAVAGDRTRVTRVTGGNTYPQVKKLEKTIKISQARRRAKIVISNDDMVSEDSSKQGRMIEDIDQDAGVILVTLTKVSSQEDQPEDQLGVLSAAKILVDATRVHMYSKKRRAVSNGRDRVSTASGIISTVEETVSTGGVSMPVSTAGMVQESTSPRATRDEEDEWENIRARVKADEELTQKLQAEKREKYSKDNRTKMLVGL